MSTPEDAKDSVLDQQTLSRRQIIPTEKGRENFEQLNNQHVTRINKVWHVLDNVLKSVEEAPAELDTLQALKTNITKYVQDLENETVPYQEFLNRHNLEQSRQEMDIFDVKFRGYRILIESGMRKLSQHIQDVQLRENVSNTSRR